VIFFLIFWKKRKEKNNVAEELRPQKEEIRRDIEKVIADDFDLESTRSVGAFVTR
jgi:hypothetical protein